MNGSELVASQTFLLALWASVMVATCIGAIAVSVWPRTLERVRKFLPAFLVSPGILVSILMLVRGFEPMERPLVHWVFEKSAADALRLGIAFDTLSASVTLFFGLAVAAIGFRNRPTVQVTSAMILSWAGLSLVGGANTLWMALLGMGIQLFSRFLPILSATGAPEVEDARWASPAKRGWIALSILLCGAAGLAASGVSLDFAEVSAWKELDDTLNRVVASGLLIFGVFLIASPFFSSHVLYNASTESFEEGQFTSETALSWAAVLIVYRLFGNLGQTPWTLAIGIAAVFSLFLSVFATVFQSDHKNASRIWISSVPLYCLTIFPFLPAHEARLYLLGAILSFVGIWICLAHRRAPVEVVFSALFFGGVFGMVGWSTSAGVSHLYSVIETEPFYRGSSILVSILFAAAGWRLVLRANAEASAHHAAVKYTLVGILLVIGLGPLLSGRWSGGGVPFELDWLTDAKEWSWVRSLPGSAGESNWIGFSIAQAILLLSLIFGTWIGAASPLYPLAERNPGGVQALRGLLGLLWIREWLGPALRRIASFWSVGVSTRFWENVLPAVAGKTGQTLRMAGAWAEKTTEPLTSNFYAEFFRAPAKLVQWLHGGNVRLYAWFALIWILIFSVYLTR